MKKSKQIQKIFIKAAELIHMRSNAYSCLAISDVIGEDTEEQREESIKLITLYNELITPVENTSVAPDDFLNGDRYEGFMPDLTFMSNERMREVTDHRTMALLFVGELLSEEL